MELPAADHSGFAPDTAFAGLIQKQADALLVSSSPLFFERRVAASAKA